jgi:hypothetical protein
VASALTGIIDQRWGWSGVSMLGAVFVAAAGLVWLLDLRRR